MTEICFFLDNGIRYKIPIGTKRNEIDAWVAKCQEPIMKIESLAQFYRHARSAIFDENSYVIVGYKTTEEEKKILEKYSQFKIRISFIEASDDLAAKYSLEPGIYITRPYSRFDGEFGLSTQMKLKFIHLPASNPDFDQLDLWVSKHNSTKVYYCDQYEKIFPLFQKTYKGPLRAVYILTSGMNPNSKKYEKMLKDLAVLADEYKDQMIFAIIPKDELAKKMGCLRNSKLRWRGQPEVRFVDYKKLVSTERGEDGAFKTVDCSDPESKCAELSESHYTGKYSFVEKLSKETLKEFIDNSLGGKNTQYYEEESLPLTAVRKLSRTNFKQEILDSDKDVLLELYGKYCPSCIVFKQEYNGLAKDLATYKENLLVAKLCIDHNFLPEISDKKKYTPIFWYYKKGDKENPIQHKGKRNKQEILDFIKHNATFNLDNN